MPNKKTDDVEKHKSSLLRKNNKLTEFINSSLEKLYSSTYYSNMMDKQDLDNIKNKLDGSIDSLVTINKTNSGKSSLSTLYSRLAVDQQDKGTEDIAKSLEDLLNDNTAMDASMMSFINGTTTSIFDYDNKIDTIIKYMPKLKEALDCRKDNVLSADHFSKDYINVTNKNLSEDTEFYNEHIKEIKERYDFEELADKVYDLTAKYGEAFVYIVPAKKAIAKLIKIKNKSGSLGRFNFKESCIINESTGDRLNFNNDIEKFNISQQDLNNSYMDSIVVECDKSGMLSSIVEASNKYDKSISFINEMALSNYDNNHSYTNENYDIVSNILNENSSSSKKDTLKADGKIINDDISFNNIEDDNRTQESIIDRKNVKTKKSNEDKTINVPGSIVEILDRKNVIPIYIKNHCFGYYVIETEGQYYPDLNKMQDPVMSLKGSRTVMNGNGDLEESQKQNNVLRFLAGQMSKYIDSNFINANQDLREEIYMILKYNERNNVRMNKLKVTFIPPDDIEHVYFSKDTDSNRGISDLHNSLFPATLYSSMYITNCLWTMTRSQDKRVYYVKQSVDTNISKTLIETINQIKKGNMNIRQIENINHILNITGKFNDYIIPKSSSGETPIDFEVMQGQQIEFKTELMTVLEEMAVNATDVPMEMIQMRQSVDYATQLSMSSSKFLRKVYNRQSKYDKNLTRMFNKLYNNEYDDNVTLEIKLPPPMFLNITNTNQMMNNVRDYSTAVGELLVDQNEDEEIKSTVIREINKKYLGSYLDLELLDGIVTNAKQIVASKTESNNEEE